MEAYFSSLVSALNDYDGEGLAQTLGLFSQQDSQIRPAPGFIKRNELANIDRMARQTMGEFPKWGDMIVDIAQAQGALHREAYQEAYTAFVSGWQKLLSIFADETAWMMALVHQAVHDIRMLAMSADLAAGGKAGQIAAKNLRETGRLLSNGFSACWNDRTDPRSPESKKTGVLYIIVAMFKTYFKLNTLRLCKNLIKAVEVKVGNRPSFVEAAAEVIPIADLVSYRFYVGRLNMFEDQYTEAEKNLDFALAHCRADAYHNKRRILAYLIPIKLYRGRLPTPLILQKYQFNEFLELTAAVRCGDLMKYNEALMTYQDVFIRKGTYLVLEKLKTLVYRNFLKRIQRIEATNQLKLQRVQLGFKWCEEDLGLDEIECIIANLIYKGHVKGYISHSKRVLVLSKTNPFPIDPILKNS